MSSPGADLVARDAELARLARLVADAREGVSGTLVLSGPPGMGKTALVEAAVAMADGFAVLRARSAEGEAGLPYATLSQLLLRVLDRRHALAA
ncbi:MAG TPA: ATP-binding protein, partial [Solirubrobacteraceae bacterium]|nr:ATP-binding protein [Solirubrobacteraceae bacterium]